MIIIYLLAVDEIICLFDNYKEYSNFIRYLYSITGQLKSPRSDTQMVVLVLNPYDF